MERKKRTTQDDPNYMSTFFKSSRLHFIGAWREVWEGLIDGHDDPLAAGCQDGEREIFHIDLDCFFASVAIRDRPELKGLPVAVCWSDSRSANSQSEISSANYVARSDGVRAGMFLGTARKLCPKIVTVPFEFEKYVQVATAAFECIFEVTKNVVGKSIDECFADVTEQVAIRGRDCVAESLRRRIFEKTGGCTVSIGSARNMLLAKVATGIAKPDGYVRVEGASCLTKMPCSALHGVGWKRAEKLSELLGPEATCGRLVEFADSPRGRDSLVQAFGENLAKDLVDMAKGIDSRPWEPRPPRKSVSAQCSYGLRCEDDEKKRVLVSELAEECCKRAEKLLRPDAVVKACGLKIWRSKMQQSSTTSIYEDPTAKDGIGHGWCDILTKSEPLMKGGNFFGTTSKDHVGSVALKLLRDLDVPAEKVRGLGVRLELADSERSGARLSVAPDQPKITDLLVAGEVERPRKRVRRAAGVVVVPIGPPGCGKSTFYLDFLSPRGAARASQDELQNKDRVRRVVGEHARKRVVYVDRCNYDRSQRRDWVEIAKRRGAECAAVVIEFDVETCIRRAQARFQHEGRLDRRDPTQCAKVVSMIADRLVPIEDDEGFDRIFHLPIDSDEDAKRRIVDEIFSMVSTKDTSPREAPRLPHPLLPVPEEPLGDIKEQLPARQKESEGEWTCRRCTYINQVSTYLCCEICGMNRR